MTRRRLDPQRLDVAWLAQEALSLQGQWALPELPRLQQSQSLPQDAEPSVVRWSVQGELRVVSGEEPQTWLHLQARTSVWLACQRCLVPMQQTLVVEQSIRFVRGEDRAEALDAESEYDVLALTQGLDLRELVEDEFLLALPIVPRHEVCPAADRQSPMGTSDVSDPHPFASLAGLKARPGTQ